MPTAGSLRFKKGMSLLEVTLAMAIAAGVMVALTMVFKVTKNSWNVNILRAEMLQHARIGLGRLSSELRYTTNLVQESFTAIEFDTAVLVDNNENTTERILYNIVGNTLERSVNGGVGYVVAGDPGGRVKVEIQATNPLKVNGSGDLVPMNLFQDSLSEAEALRVVLRFTGSDNQSFEIRTQPTFRGK